MTSEDGKHRSPLPIPTPQRTGLITYDAKDPDTKFPPIEQLRPPQGAPNVLRILIGDAGFGSSSAFGGPCQTPNAGKLAAGGLKNNRFHTTALCSPTRQALLTERNHHSAGMGGITELTTGARRWRLTSPSSSTSRPAPQGQIARRDHRPQKALGIILPDCQLTARHEEIPAGMICQRRSSPSCAVKMEVYAGFLEHAQEMAAHESPRTTKLYGRTKEHSTQGRANSNVS
jgi:arylsulfatase A-like enzyme